MNVRELIRFLTGASRAHTEPGPSQSACPHESEVLAYIEGRASTQRREQMVGHFVDCGECREFLALYIRASREPLEARDGVVAVPNESADLKRQSARVLTMIDEDEVNHTRTVEPQRKGQQSRGFYVSLPRLSFAAVVAISILVGTITLLMRTAPLEQVAMATLADAVKTERRTPVRISGGFEYSPPQQVTRGDSPSENTSDSDLHFERVFTKLKPAEKPSAAPSLRLVLARAYLARGASGDASRARTILEEIAATEGNSAEIDNDKGVALFQLGNYRAALASFSKAIDDKPDFYEARFNKALAEEKLKLYADARQDWEQFIKASPDEKWKAEAQRNLDALKNAPVQ